MVRNKEYSKTEARIIRSVFRSNYFLLLMATFIVMSGMLVDSILISRYMNETAIASYGAVMSVFVLLNVFSGVLSAGGQNVLGKKLGLGEIDDANRINACISVCTIILSIILIILALVFHKGILTLLGCPESTGELYVMSRDYLFGLVIGVPGIMWTLVYGTLLAVDSDAKRTFLGTLVLTIVNILGDFLNVFVLHWGMFGMALMTSISYYSDLAVIMPHYLSERYSLKILGHGIDFSSIPDIVKAGLTTAFQRAANVVKLAGINRLLFFMASASAVASFTVGKAGSNLYFPIAISVGMTTLMVGSAFVSEEDKSSLLIILRTMFMYCYGPILIITIVILILAKPLTALFLAESEPSFRDAYMVNLSMIASLPFHAINNGMINYLQSIGKVRSSMIFTVMENGAFPIACACGLGFIFGVKGVWISLFVTEIIMFLVIIGYDAFCEKKVPRTVEDFLMIGKEFGVAAEDEFRSTLTDQEGVIACSEEIRQFCISRNLPKRTAMLMALCVEEMCGNIIKHGFKPGKKNTIDIRLFCKEGKITLRVRDNCKPFDPKKQYEIYKQEGDVSNYGIRMIAQMTSDMRYVNLMRMNVLYMETCI